LQKIKKRTLKIARRKETGKISDESPSKIGFLGSATVSISFCKFRFPYFPKQCILLSQIGNENAPVIIRFGASETNLVAHLSGRDRISIKDKSDERTGK
jgi:hypothetical protein